jgi:hypothetical protein
MHRRHQQLHDLGWGIQIPVVGTGVVEPTVIEPGRTRRRAVVRGELQHVGAVLR